MENIKSKLENIVSIIFILGYISFLTYTMNEDRLTTRQELFKYIKENGRLEQELNTLKEEYNKLASSKKKITAYIKKMNPALAESQVKQYSQTIIKTSDEYGYDPLLHAALIKSESTFKSSAKHSIKTVIGLGGVYWDKWSKKLKTAGIADKITDLQNPITNIKASGFILAEYLKQKNNRVYEAVVCYKGVSDVGRERATKVVAEYNNIKV